MTEVAYIDPVTGSDVYYEDHNTTNYYRWKSACQTLAEMVIQDGETSTEIKRYAKLLIEG